MDAPVNPMPPPLGLLEAAQVAAKLQLLSADPALRLEQLHQLRGTTAEIWLSLPEASVPAAWEAGFLQSTLVLSALLAGTRLPAEHELLLTRVRRALQEDPCDRSACAAITFLGSLGEDEERIFPAASTHGKQKLLPALLAHGVDLEEGGQEREYRRLKMVTDQILGWLPSAQAEERRILLRDFGSLYSIFPSYLLNSDTVRMATLRMQLLHALYDRPGMHTHYQPAGPVPQGRRIRVGILARSFAACAETYSLLPVFEHLDQSRFETYLLALNIQDTPTEAYCVARASQARELPADLPGLISAVRALDLDILLVGDNLSEGLGPVPAAAGLHRLARIQSNYSNSPITSGFPYLDCFLLGEDCEASAGVESRYTERLMRLPGSGFCFTFTGRDETPGRTVQRSDLGILPDEVVFVSGAEYRKCLPKVRDAWARILAAVPASVLLLYPFAPGLSEDFPKEHIVESILRSFDQHGVARDRLIVVGPMKNIQEIRSLLHCSDVYLDAFPFSGAAALQDPLDVCVPPVVMDGAELRFRQGAAIMREAGLQALVAADVDTYIELAASLGRDGALRSRRVAQVQDAMCNRPPFRDARRFALGVARAFEQMVANWNQAFKQAGNETLTTGTPDATLKAPMNDLARYFHNNRGRMIDKWLHYFEIYERHFARFRGRPITLVEIGVFQGGSLQMWRDYFGPQARIFGVDVNPMVKWFETPGTRIIIGDQSNRAFLGKLVEELPPIDILIDDGGHTMDQQTTTFDVLFPKVAPDGVYLCEDLHTSYWPEYGGGHLHPGTFIEFSKTLVDRLNAFHARGAQSLPVSDFTRTTNSLHFYDSVLVVEKRLRDQPESLRTGFASLPNASFRPPDA